MRPGRRNQRKLARAEILWSIDLKYPLYFLVCGGKLPLTCRAISIAESYLPSAAQEPGESTRNYEPIGSSTFGVKLPCKP